MLELVASASARGAEEVFERMIRLRPQASRDADSALSGDWVTGVVGLDSESLRISLMLHIPQPLAQELTDRLLRQPPGSAVPDVGSVRDAVAEITNMIAGRVKSSLGEEHLPLLQSLPSVFEGRDFAVAEDLASGFFRYRLQFDAGACWIAGAVLDGGEGRRAARAA